MSEDKRYKKIKYTYPQERNAVFIMGAGASYPDGVPLQSEIIPIILSSKYSEIAKSEIGKTIINFINDNFYYNFKLKIFPTLEELFAYIDFFINQGIDLNSEYKNEKFVEIKESLIKLIHYVIGKYSREIADSYEKQNKKYYRKFWELIKDTNRNISIISLNYDTLLEESFDFLYPHHGVIDYCINFMNYNHIQGIDAFNWWDNPREELIVWGDSKPIPVKIMKIHGSLNWKYCKTCSKVLLTPWDTDIDINRGSFIQRDYETHESFIYRCPIDETIFETMILQPSYMKNFKNPNIFKIFNETILEIESSKKVIIIGYSFPDADVHIRALMQKAIKTKKRIIVIDINTTKDFLNRYRTLDKDIDFIQISFQDLINDQKLFFNLLND